MSQWDAVSTLANDWDSVSTLAGDQSQAKQRKVNAQIEAGLGPVLAPAFRGFTKYVAGPAAIGTIQAAEDITAAGSRALGFAGQAAPFVSGQPAHDIADEINRANALIDQDRPLGPGLQSDVQGATRSLIPSYLAGRVGGTPGIIGFNAYSTGQQAYTRGKDAGLKPADAVKYAITTGAIEGGFTAGFQKFLPGLEQVIAGKTAYKSVFEAVKRHVKATAQELPEEGAIGYAQAFTDWWFGVNPNALSAEQRNQMARSVIGQTAVMGAATAPLQVASAAQVGLDRKKRLDELKAIRSKGYISTEDGQKAGIEGETRKQRWANAVAEETKLEQEIEDASTVQRPEAEVRQEQGGEDLRGQGQVEVRPEPAGEGAPAQEEVRVRSQELKDFLDEALAAAPEAAPQEPRPEVADVAGVSIVNTRPQPIEIGETGETWRPVAPGEVLPPGYKTRLPVDGGQVMTTAPPADAAAPPAEAPAEPRDVAAEIQEALTQGPVSVTTTRVQKSPIKVAKVNDDGTLTTKKGRKVPLDEVLEVIKPVPSAPETPEEAAPEPEKTTPAKEPWQMTREEFWNTPGRKADANHYNVVSMAVREGKPVPPEVLADYPDLQPKKNGRKDQQQPVQQPAAQPLADVLEPESVAKTVAEQAREKGEAYVVPFTNWSKREATNKALREAGLEPVPEKLNYWRVAQKPPPTEKPKVVGKSGQTAIPGLEEEAERAEARDEEDARWKPYRDQLIAKSIGVTEEAAQELMRGFAAKVKAALLDNTGENAIYLADLLTADMPILKSGQRGSEQSRRDTATELIEPAVAEVMAEIAPTLEEAGGWKVGQNVETRYPTMFGKITGFEMVSGELQARVKPSDGTDSTTVELSDIAGEYTPEPEESGPDERQEEQDADERHRATLEKAHQAVAKEKAGKKEDWSVSRDDVEKAFTDWGGKSLEDWVYSPGRAVKVLDQPDYIEGDVVDKTFLNPLRRSRDNSHLLWIGGKLYRFAGWEVTAMEQPLEDVDMETTVKTRKTDDQTVVRHVVTWRDEKGQERGEAFHSLGKAKDRAKEIGKGAEVRTEVGMVEGGDVKPEDAPEVISYKDGRYVISDSLTPQQAAAAMEEIRDKYKYRGGNEVDALKDLLAGEAIKTNEGEPRSIKDKRKLYQRAMSEQIKAEAERGRLQSDATKMLERRAKEIARERGVPEGQSRGSLSKAKQYQSAIAQAKQDAKKDPLVVESERLLAHATKAYETAARHAGEFKAELNKATRGEPIPEGSVFVSKLKGGTIAIRVGDYDEESGTYEYENGTLASGKFYGHSYGGTGERGITGQAIRENYGSIEDSRAMRAVAMQAIQAIEQAQEARFKAEAEKKASAEAQKTRETYTTEYKKPTVAQIMPLGSMMYAKSGEKPVITDGRFAILTDEAPKAMQKRMGIEGIRGGRFSEERPVDIGKAIPMKGKPPAQLQPAGYVAGGELTDHVLLTDGESFWRIDAQLYSYLTPEGITFHGPEAQSIGSESEVVILAKGGNRIGGIMPIGDEPGSLKSLKEAVGDKFQMTEPPKKKKKTLKESADEAVQEALDAEDELAKHLKGKKFSGVDPQAVLLAGKVVYKWAKAGYRKFRVMLEQLAQKIGQAKVDALESVLGDEWDKLQKSGEFPGMEARTPETQAEPPPLDGDDLTSIKKEIINDLREEAGLDAVAGSAAQSVEEWVETARVTLAADPKAAIRLVNELAGQNARPINQHDAMLLQFRYRQLANALKPAADAYFAAVDSKDPLEISTAKTALIDARKAMTEFEEIIHQSKETWGRAGVALQQMLRQDYSLEAILRRGREENHGEELNEQQTVELTELARKYEDLQKRLDAEQKKNAELQAELASERQHEEAVKEAKQKKVYRKSEKRVAAERKVSDAWEKFRQAALTQAGAGPHLLGPAVEVAKAYVELGYVRLGEFMAAVRKNVPDADEKLFRQAWDQAASEAGVEVAEIDQNDRSAMTKESRRIQRSLVEAGVVDRDEIIDVVHASLQESIPDLTRQQAMEALAGHGAFKRPTKDEITTQINRMNAELRKLTTTAEQRDSQAQKSYVASLQKRIADYQQTLAEGDFAPKPKKEPRALSPVELKLKREMEDVRHEVLQKYAEYHLAHLHGMAWGVDKIAEAAHLSRALMTSFDLSALGRQGGLVAMGHPVLAKRALVETIASIAHSFDAKAIGKGFTLKDAEKFLTGLDSRQAEFNFMHKLTEGPQGEFRQRAGLDLPNSDEKITRQEEAFQGRWGKRVPGIALSSRLYTMILNKLRADLFDSMVQNLGRNGQVTMEEAKIIANFVNVATGRSSALQVRVGGSLVDATAILNMAFFAPRYVASRFQYLAMPFYLPFTPGSRRVKQAIYREYARTTAGIGTTLGLFALLGMLFYDDDDEDRPIVSFDMTSSDFLKVRIGETRLDFLAGLQQVFVLSARLSRESFDFEGETRDTPLSVALRFGRTKLAPVPGAVTTAMNDWINVVGEEETPASLVVGMLTPLSLEDVAETMQTHGIPKGTALSLLSILGFGMSTYGPKTQYMTGSPEERLSQIEEDLKSLSWDSPEPAYSEFLTPEQIDAFEQQKRYKRGLVVYNAMYSGENEDELKTREKNRGYLEEMRASGITHDEAQELLEGLYRRQRPAKKGEKDRLETEFQADRPGKLDPGYLSRSLALAEWYGAEDPKAAVRAFRNSEPFKARWEAFKSEARRTASR